MTENTNDGNNQENRYISEPDQQGVRYYNVNELYGHGGQRHTEPEMKKRRPMWKNFLIFVLVLAVIMAIPTIGLFNSQSSNGEKVILPSSEYIASIYVEGVIQAGNSDYFGNAVGYQHDWTLQVIDDLMKDRNNRGIIMFVDSPGGTIYESDELYMKILQYKQITKRPVYSVMGSMAASGGYYISAPCDEIFANRNTWTGSIGVTIGSIFDVSDFLNKYGIKVKTITSGENKAMGSSYQPMTAEEEAIWQGLVNEAYEQFVQVVAEGRGLEVDYVKTISDGRIYSASQAKQIGLVDEIGDIYDAYWSMIDEYKISDGCDLIDIEYQVERNWISNLLGAVNKNYDNEAAVVLELLSKQGGYPASYLCEALAQ